MALSISINHDLDTITIGNQLFYGERRYKALELEKTLIQEQLDFYKKEFQRIEELERQLWQLRNDMEKIGTQAFNSLS